MYTEPFSPKQKEFILASKSKFNLAHGSVRSGKTVGVLWRFMQLALNHPGEQIWMIGHTQSSVYHNCIRVIMDSSQFLPFSKFCTWMPGNNELRFGTRTIYCLGARDEGSIGPIQGKTFDLCYCNEMTLYPVNVIQMIATRLSNPHSMLLADMNPVQPDHICKHWIDLAEGGDKNYYSLHYSIDDNPYLTEEYKAIQRQTLTGLFYRRNYLGEWCLAEGAIFDFFDRSIHVVARPPRAAEFWIAGIDYGASNPFACVLIGVATGQYGTGAHMWVEKEYYYDPKASRQKTNSEYARDLIAFFGDYSLRAVYIDPSAASFKAEMRKNGVHVVDADNDVYDGILLMTNLMKEGTLTVCKSCSNLIREMEGYVWDPSASKQGYDEPMKKNDHACFCELTQVSGAGPIERLEIGCSVWTTQGRKLIEATGSRLADCFSYEIGGRQIMCTPDHPFYTMNGWKNASDLLQSDILITANEKLWNQKSLNSKEKNIADIQNLVRNLTENISNAEASIYIEKFGDPILAKYQKDFIYITSTKTHLTMIYPILNAFLQNNMQAGIEKIINLALQMHADNSRQDGINPWLEENGILNMLKNLISESSSLLVIRARCAKKFMNHQREALANFVQTNASLDGEDELILTMKPETVFNVANNFKLTVTRKKDTALDRVPSEHIGIQEVYNISVEDQHEYFVEGFLVSNCDALRYAVKTFMKGRVSLKNINDNDSHGGSLVKGKSSGPIDWGHGWQQRF